MRRSLLLRAAGLAVALAGTACNVVGSWETISVDPPSRPFPIDAITFAEDRQYTATGREGGQRRTTTGIYRFNGFTLALTPAGGPEWRCAARLNGDRLTLADRRAKEPVSATLARKSP